MILTASCRRNDPHKESEDFQGGTLRFMYSYRLLEANTPKEHSNCFPSIKTSFHCCTCYLGDQWECRSPTPAELRLQCWSLNSSLISESSVYTTKEARKACSLFRRAIYGICFIAVRSKLHSKEPNQQLRGCRLCSWYLQCTVFRIIVLNLPTGTPPCFISYRRELLTKDPVSLQ